MEQLEFKFVIDERRAEVQKLLDKAKKDLAFCIEHSEDFGYADRVFKEYRVSRLTRELGQFP